MLFGYAKSQPKLTIQEFPQPKNLQECFAILDDLVSTEDKAKLKGLSNDSIYFHRELLITEPDLYHTWLGPDKSAIKIYFQKYGIKSAFEIYPVILIAYRDYLDGQPLEIRKIRRNWQELVNHRLKTDTLYNIYIPIDLQDCFLQLDKILSEKDKEIIKSSNSSIRFHMNLGLWIRNNWGLWVGSRLRQFFLRKRITHPDSMSGIILSFYIQWLNGHHENWQHWQKTKRSKKQTISI